VGPDEDSLLTRIREICSADTQKVIHVDFTNSPESYFNAADIFCLPSYREGFGSTIIEAAACGIPSVASRIYGVTDAVIDGQTGLLHAATDISELIRCVELLISNENLYKSMSDAAYKRSVIDFDQQNLSKSLFNYYQSILLTNIK
jgi:glycosyltransferase involved in cell wall biosynthesis